MRSLNLASSTYCAGVRLQGARAGRALLPVLLLALMIILLAALVVVAGPWMRGPHIDTLRAERPGSDSEVAPAASPASVPNPEAPAVEPVVVAENGEATAPVSRQDSAPGFMELPVPLSGAADPAAQVSLYHPGSTRPLSAEVAAGANRTLREQSDLIAAAPFDADAFAADPESYLQAVVPSRIWQSAAPAEGVPSLTAVGYEVFELQPGASVELQARTQPGAPVTFQTQGLGEFPNGRTTISVRADSEGIARVRYEASPGAIADVPILAASPLAMGQLAFHLFIADPTASE